MSVVGPMGADAPMEAVQAFDLLHAYGRRASMHEAIALAVRVRE